MATLVFSAVGTALAGPLGGAIGAVAGRQFDTALFGPSRRGPRLRELEVTLSSYGQPIPRVFGRMRIPGAIIWATELQEHSEVTGGKGQPATTRYSYTANLAVALSSRPIKGLGRIWADGKLLRGAGGDLKVGGMLRLYTGGETQLPDPLIAAQEGEAACPAFRGLAYLVLEGLELSDFGNRVPSMTFEVIADEAVRLSDLAEDLETAIMEDDSLDGVTGLLVDDGIASTLSDLGRVFPITLDAAGSTPRLRIPTPAAPMQDAALLDAPSIAMEDDSFGRRSGSRRHRASAGSSASPVLRFYDIERDFLPGTQHISGRAITGQPELIELPAALSPAQARVLVDRVAQEADGLRDRLAWRTTTLDTAISPGTMVRLPDQLGRWRVESWEWRESGVELELVRVRVATPEASTPPPGMFQSPIDAPAASTALVALELPWDATSGMADRPRLAVAVGATSANWRGAALYVEREGGQLQPLTTTSRTRAVLGAARDVLATASPLLLDRASHVTIELTAPDQMLRPADLADLDRGANMAILGQEILQFLLAEPLGGGRWRLSGFLRGLAGTQGAIATHVSGEPFALIDERLTIIDSTAAQWEGASRTLAIGLGDVAPASSPILLPGIARTPLAPVHPRAVLLANGGLQLSWARRARGNWRWRDGVDVPLCEEAERYRVTIESDGEIHRVWMTTEPTLRISFEDLADLRLMAPGGVFHARQQGTHTLSPPLILAPLL